MAGIKHFYIAFTDADGADSALIDATNEKAARAAFSEHYTDARIDFVENHTVAGYCDRCRENKYVCETLIGAGLTCLCGTPLMSSDEAERNRDQATQDYAGDGTRNYDEPPDEPEESDEARDEADARYAYGPLPDMIRAATKRQQLYELGGADDELSPLEALIADLKTAIEEADAMLHHAHVWNGEDYCDICGADGRA